ncbi:hypothetical protein POV27_05685 [Aureisphaera galaxeae]|uniref:hypothetical protein n=1 Tax=Aureisphaera galaxeae TaxID=1538023 RepID=UPI0023508B27|nr:hypothetical protein [Aureisphaera galaxeae]MDC8003532.1 hypothetical protein [Aureisphaera galaxeae]
MKRNLFFILVLIATLFYTASPSYAQNTGDTSIDTERKFDDDFKERYSNNRFNYEGKEVVRNSRNGSGRFAEFDPEDKPKLEEQNNETVIEVDSPFSGNIIQWLLIIVLVIAVLYLIFVLLNDGGQGLFSSKRDRKINGEEELTVENIGQIDIRSLIQKAEQDGDYRLAIRYYYILVLKTLSINNFIKLEDDKTNEEYYDEIKSQPFSKGFSYTSYLYNYIWYGEFPINESQYGKAKGNFDNLIKKVA